jgi:hypothetical protein
MLDLIFNDTLDLLFTEGGDLALDTDCCCEITCCSFVGTTIYARICMTACSCGTGYPAFVEIDFTLTWSVPNNRWEGSFSVPGCGGPTMNVRLTYQETFDPHECQFFWSDDGCGDDWMEPLQVDTTNCNITCDPFLWSVGLPRAADAERYRCLCPGGTWPDPPIGGAEGPTFVAYGFCDPDDRTCDP